MDDDNFRADYYGFPQGFGGLECNGSEDDIFSCPVCLFPLESDGGEDEVPIVVILDETEFQLDSEIPGAACCRGDSRQFIDDNVDIVAISCLSESGLHRMNTNKYIAQSLDIRTDAQIFTIIIMRLPLVIKKESLSIWVNIIINYFQFHLPALMEKSD